MLLLKNVRSSVVQARYLAQPLYQNSQRTAMKISSIHIASKILNRKRQAILNFLCCSQSIHREFQVLSWSENVRIYSSNAAHSDSNLKHIYGTPLEGLHARDIYSVAISAVEPQQMIRNVLKYDANQSILTVNHTQYKLNRNVYVVGFGKAVLGMGRTVEDILGEHIVRGILSIPTGQREVLRQEKKWDLLLQPHTKIQVFEGGKHNLPDENSFQASRAIEELVSGKRDTDLIIVLVSGGGAFLIPSPQPPISLEDLVVVTKELENHGASAKDINIVRKNVETLKSGGLVTAARPAKVVSLIISDIIGDDLGMISSGPTVYNQVTAHQCFEIFKRLNVLHKIPQTVLAHLQQQVIKETAKAMLGKGKSRSKMSVSPKGLEDLEIPHYARIQNVLVGSNTIACQAAAERARELGYLPFILSTELEGEARQIGARLAKLGIYTLMCFDRRLWSRAHAPFLHLELQIVKEGVSKTKLNEIANYVERAQNLGKSVVIIAGGESVVNVVGTGNGGQNQEVALAAAIELHNIYGIIEPHARADITLLSADTDGEDGPCCPAAGAVVDQNFVRNAQEEGLSCQDALKNNDSHTLFSIVNGGAHLVVTRMTGTKVMDIQVLIVGNPSRSKYWRCLPAVKVSAESLQHLLNRSTHSAYVTRVQNHSRSWDLHRLVSSDLASPGHTSHNNLSVKRSLRGVSFTTASRLGLGCNRLAKTRGCTSPLAQRLRQLCDAQFGVSSFKMASTSTCAAKPEASMPDPGSRDLQARSQLREVFLTAVRSGMPREMLEKVLKYDPSSSTLTVEGRKYDVNRNIFVVGFGKAVLGMARVVDDVLGDHIIRGIVSIPNGSMADLKANGHSDMLLSPDSKIRVQEGAKHNLPDEEAFRAARDIHQLVSSLTERDIVLVLMSGGGSALLPYPVEPLTLDDLLQVTRVLFSHGASISDVNTVRLHLELLKGGGLAREAKPARVVSFIISDVIGDSLEMIASGPTVRQPRSPHRCLEIIDRLQARESLPRLVVEVLETKKTQIMAQASLSWSGTQGAGRTGGIIEEDDMVEWDRVQNVLVGTNAIACHAAAHRAQELGFVPYILTTELSGEAKEVGVLFAKLAQYIIACFSPRLSQTTKPELVQLEMEIAKLGIPKNKLNEVADKVLVASNHSKPLCVVAGGETVVNLRGKGKGGRNQEMVLSAGLQLQQGFQTLKSRKEPTEVLFLSAGTDGQDGPTNAAGALVDENFVLNAVTQSLDPAASLQENDSYTLWSRFNGGRDLLVTGLTGTNVMDIQLLLVQKPRAVGV